MDAEVRTYTYSEAKKLACKENEGITYIGDAGNGWTFQVSWYNGRQHWLSVNPDGMVIV